MQNLKHDTKSDFMEWCNFPFVKHPKESHPQREKEWSFVEDVATYTDGSKGIIIIDKIKMVEVDKKFHLERVPVYHKGELEKREKAGITKKLVTAIKKYGSENFSVWRRCIQCDELFPKASENKVLCTNACKIKHHREMKKKDEVN